MTSRLGRHVHNHLVGYVALFVGSSGTAWAANGPLAAQNTVGTAAIVNGQVKRPDIAANAINASAREGR